MYQYEDVLIKISNDFHNAINPILVELDISVKNDYWFSRESIEGKLFIINELLLTIGELNGNLDQIRNLSALLKEYKRKLELYFDRHDIATGFIFFSPEDVAKIRNFFSSLEEFTFGYLFSLSIGYRFFTGMELIGFPSDCSYRLTAKIKDNEIVVDKRYDPVFKIEIDKGIEIGSPTRTRAQQDDIESQLWDSCEQRLTEEKKIESEFKNFAEQVWSDIKCVMNDFDKCISFCDEHIKSIHSKTINSNMPELEKIHLALNGYFFEVPFEYFGAVVAPRFSGTKITWLESGAQLKYFIDNVNRKLNLSSKINQWASERFEMTEPISDMASYLGKQTSKDEYKLLIQGNLRRNPLFRLFRE